MPNEDKNAQQPAGNAQVADETDRDALLARIAELEAQAKNEKDRASAAEAKADKAEKEAEKLKKKNDKVEKADTAKNERPPGAELDELVTVELFKDDDKYKDDVDICVNGERIIIQRGKRIQIKRKFAEALRHSMKQDKAARSIIEQYGDEYRERFKHLT